MAEPRAGEAETMPEVLLVTGMSGAGKTAASAALDDQGWFVVDNLPPSLLMDLVSTVGKYEASRRLAVVVDVRGGVFFGELRGALDEMEKDGVTPTVLFLEASDEVLVRRFESARRPHPLQGGGRVVEAIERERQELASLRVAADLVIDTSLLNIHELTARIRTAFAGDEIGMRAVVVSFGFKYGLPVDADLVADMRFLPNPHWIPELQVQTGRESAVSDYVLNQPGATEFLDRYSELVSVVSEGYLREGKRFVTIGIGCTGGKHRSVAMGEALAARLRDQSVETLVVHRDLGRE
ncbi:RNase adapter RapZ [Actinobacteria bacterium YIM 96077]|uniref:RNase adapter RapZ n=1 Tax=Phytoactinopolyspora halophila TaxID=1981511 RepID=A0A329QA47_9ACTN|nr:RNase adapter RapZ [Phytoactinopolyspora halophila]AYY12913.1 RNase adapter RapZ [Actinobacteria bacterium YIM 96077]RAW09290.1 RNase adapter RapZ [Phytoactinopolyspora halophila]